MWTLTIYGLIVYALYVGLYVPGIFWRSEWPWRKNLRILTIVTLVPAFPVMFSWSYFQKWKSDYAKRKREATEREEADQFAAKCVIAFGFNPQMSSWRNSAVLQWWVHEELERSRVAKEAAFRAQEQARHSNPPQDTDMIDEIVRGVKQRDRELYDLAQSLLGCLQVFS
ncbi:MAG: hypothetical protein Q7K38_01950 [Candidatus Wildermuthbacteria bacterium]|nr:hypothetical protein [Candidatus Wildermuthbacteria bacterium]